MLSAGRRVVVEGQAPNQSVAQALHTLLPGNKFFLLAKGKWTRIDRNAPLLQPVRNNDQMALQH